MNLEGVRTEEMSSSTFTQLSKIFSYSYGSIITPNGLKVNSL